MKLMCLLRISTFQLHCIPLEPHKSGFLVGFFSFFEFFEFVPRITSLQIELELGISYVQLVEVLDVPGGGGGVLIFQLSFHPFTVSF